MSYAPQIQGAEAMVAECNAALFDRVAEDPNMVIDGDVTDKKPSDTAVSDVITNNTIESVITSKNHTYAQVVNNNVDTPMKDT